MLALPSLGTRVMEAKLYASGERVAMTQSEGGVTLTLPSGGGDDPDRVVVLTLARR